MNSHIDFKETSRLLNGYGSEAITSCSSNSSSSSSSSSSCRSSGSGSGKSVPWMQRRRSATFCFVGLVAAAVVGIAALSSTQEGVIIYSSSLWSQKEMFSGKVPNALVPAVLSDVGDTLKLKVYNDDYEKSPASLGIYYKWSYNLEPGRNNHLEISLEDSSRCVFVSLFTCTLVFSSRWLTTFVVIFYYLD